VEGVIATIASFWCQSVLLNGITKTGPHPVKQIFVKQMFMFGDGMCEY